MRRSSILALSVLAFGASLPLACTQNFDIFTGGSGGLGGSTTSSTTTASTSSGTTSSSSSSSTTTTTTGGGCKTAADCEDSNACTTDACGADGKCTNTNLPDGNVPGYVDTPGDCQTARCVSGVPQGVNLDTDVPANSNPCVVLTCSNGQVVTTNEPTTTTCGTGSSHCDGSGNCVGCTQNSDCPDPGACKARHCDTTSHTCAPTISPSGASCGGTNVCDGSGNCVACVQDSDCPNPGACKVKHCDTTNHTCAPTNAQSGTSCGGTNVCTSAGTCVACLTDTNCGGYPQICNATNQCVSSCNDTTTDGNETDLNCGGSCPKCADSKLCLVNSDCSGGQCYVTGGGAGTKTCHSDLCADGTKDGNESDVDCGGSCPKCANGQTCGGPSDCQSNYCPAGTPRICLASQCTDGLLDGNETDVDCGGGTCPTCADTKICNADSDCTGGHCYVTGGGTGTKTCHSDLCSDGVTDGGETDVDCGGNTTCQRCATGLACTTGTDCKNGGCVGNPKHCN